MESTATTVIDDDDYDTWWFEPYFKSIGAFGGPEMVSIWVEDDLEIPILKDGFLGLQFTKETTTQDVREILELLNRHVEFVSYTGPKVEEENQAAEKGSE